MSDPASDRIEPPETDSSKEIGPEAECLRVAAQAAGIATDVVVGVRGGERQAWLRLQVGDRAYLYKKGILLHAADDPNEPFGPHINGRAAARTSTKHRTKERLNAAGVATPEGRVFEADDPGAAVAYGAALGGPVCVKPNTGWAGQYVHPGLEDPARIEAAFRRAARLGRRVLVERSVAGEALRLIYLAPDCVAAKINRAPGVTGDGRSTVAALIAGRDRIIAERRLPMHKPIRDGAEMRRVLAAQGLGIASVPAAGRRVTLGLVCNVSRGADSLDGRPGTHPSYFEVAARAGRALADLKIAAIDMIVADRAAPAAPGNHWVLEINSSPGISDFLHPWSGEPQDVGAMLVAFLQREGAGSTPAPAATASPQRRQRGGSGTA